MTLLTNITIEPKAHARPRLPEAINTTFVPTKLSEAEIHHFKYERIMDTQRAMEMLFMRAFERRDAAEVQMRQQAASYSRTLACGLLAAGHQPPPRLLPHPAPFAALVRRGTAEEQMQLQVEAYT